MTLSDRLRAIAKRTALDGIAEELLAIADNEIDDFTEAEKFRCEQSKQLCATMEANGDFETEDFGFAQELVTQYGGDWIDDNAEVYKIRAKDLYVIMKMLGYGRKADAVHADELPGMWDHSDLVGGETDTVQATPEPSRGMIGMGTQALVGELADALNKDTQSENSLGMLGANTMAWLRKVATEYLSKPATPPQQAAGEPVYQYQRGDGSWIDQTRASYDYNVKHGNAVRVLHTHPAPGVPAKLPSAYATSTEDGTWRVLLAFDNKDDAEATRRFLHDHGVQPRTMRSTAPGVPEGFALVPMTEDELDEMALQLGREMKGLRCWGWMDLVRAVERHHSKKLAAAQAKGGAA